MAEELWKDPLQAQMQILSTMLWTLSCLL